MFLFLLHSATNITSVDKLRNLTLHAGPLESLLEVLIHVGTAWMDGKKGIMRFIQDSFSEITLWNHRTVLKEQSALVVNTNALILGNALGHTFLHFLHHCIKKLSLVN